MRGHAARYAATIIRVRSDACRLDKIQSPAMSPRTPSELAIWVSQHSTHGYLSTAHGWTEALALVVEGVWRESGIHQGQAILSQEKSVSGTLTGRLRAAVWRGWRAALLSPVRQV